MVTCSSVRAKAALLIVGASSLVGCETLTMATGIARYERTLDAYAQEDTTATDVSNTRHSDGREAKLLSAFFGLDNALPAGRTDRVACEGAGGADGMPVIFSHEVDQTTLEPGDFRVTTASGKIGHVACLTLAPADDPGELRTALLAGEYGSAEDPPVIVEIVGNVLSLDNTINFKGASVDAIPLEPGPTLVWAEIVPPAQWGLGQKATSLVWGGGSRCPIDTEQVVRATWAGGVTKPGGAEPGDLEREMYKVTIALPEGGEREVTPFALADLTDGDNNHLLCLDTRGTPVRVSFAAGGLTDPNEDLNPNTDVLVWRDGTDPAAF
ncbi:hypothetical protein PB2503_11734 [Parvularcula bermudensis HTCC2503]|uniref:Uncharacterized protein n=1 Tax=Parvularcula bermudensis (strain ATCC BAA-594 / HTCC2503 / KCTC 12087) TaxID=314260 RepID=E0TDG5_PARBH|nr:hypothetical protein [Parvularcula bermudensis]ADM10391.1 hypothetical protein PB2503_11734 [Parvularcula bermudensis HTCC2503]